MQPYIQLPAGNSSVQNEIVKLYNYVCSETIITLVIVTIATYNTYNYIKLLYILLTNVYYYS